MPPYQRLAVLSRGPLLLGELLSQHGQLGFCPGDGLYIVLNASRGQRSGWTRFFDLLVVLSSRMRNCLFQRQRGYQFV